MNSTVVPYGKERVRTLSAAPVSRMCRRLVFSLLENLAHGKLTVRERGREDAFGENRTDTLEAMIAVRDPAFYVLTALGGSLGAAQAYMAGYWTADNLTAVLRIALRNQAIFEKMENGWGRTLRPLHHLFHLLRRNTLAGSRKNILAHYDLGDAFYRLFLDKTMAYSCGIFETAHSTLEDAAAAKYERICRKLELGPRDNLLEIGTGWGGFALHAAKNYGCSITTTTISEAQYRWARSLFAREGLSDRITVLSRDYRYLTGCFDKLVAIEMIEAVGHHYLDRFFRLCGDRLAEDGRMLLQAITIADHRFERHKKSVDFIKRYIFPGSCLPSVTAMCRSASRTTDLRPFHLEDITPHYVITLRKWRERFFSNLDDVRKLGYGEVFIRMWEFYLCYCEAGFAERYIGDVQMMFAKPLFRGALAPAYPA